MNDPVLLFRQAMDALDRGHWQQARAFAMQAASFAPRDGGVHYIAGVASLQLGQLRPALEHLRLAAARDPARVDYLAQLARALVMAHQLQEAVAVADAAMALPATDAGALDTLGVVFSHAHVHARAREAFRRAVALAPGHAGFHYNLATSELFFGEIEAAEREYEACLSCDPRQWRAYLSLAQLRTQTPSANHVARFADVLGRHEAEPAARLHLNLALAKAYEDLGDHGRAFASYARGKAAARSGADADASRRDAEAFAAVTDYFAVPRTCTGFDSDEPIFIMGMPRSGTTLLDRILSAHSAVTSAGELHNFAGVLHQAFGRPASRETMLRDFDRGFDDWRGLGERYIASTRPLTGGTPRFTDKLPQNILLAGFIACALPRARLICLRREPMDTCLSNFRQLFAAGDPDHAYANDLLDTGRHYLLFDRLVAHWRQVLPGRLLEVRYEDLVDAQEQVTRQVLAFCGLPWEDACLSFHDSAAPVETASAAQVRVPMNRRSLGRWRRYEAELAPLRRLLEDGGISIG